MGDQVLSSGGARRNLAPWEVVKTPAQCPVLDKNRAPTGPEILSTTGGGACLEEGSWGSSTLQRCGG